MRKFNRCGSIKYYKLLFICISVICLMMTIYIYVPITINRNFWNKSIYEESFRNWVESIIIREPQTHINSRNDSTKLLLTSETSKITEQDLSDNWTITTLQLNDNNKCTLFKELELQKAIITAIKDGKQFIYINSRPDKQIRHYLDRFYYEQTVFIMKYVGTSQTPLKNHFLTLPNTIKNITVSSISYELSLWNRSSIQKILYKNELDTAGQIDMKAPPLILGKNIFVPFSMDNTLFHYDAFWALIQFDDHHIWSIWVQRLLQEVDNRVVFMTVNHDSNLCHKDMSIDHISKAISTWKCTNRTDFFNCVHALNMFMVSKNIILNEMANNINNWLMLLTKSGYKQPLLVKESSTTKSAINKVVYVPTIDNVKQNLNESFGNVCKKPLGSCPQQTKPYKRITDILMIIVFNHGKHYDVVEYLLKIYLPTFTHLIVCGTLYSNFMKAFPKFTYPVSFIEMPSAIFSAGERSSLCLQSVSRLNYDIEGYLHLGDDVLLNVWNMPKFPTNQIWFQEMLRPANITQPTVPDVWKNKIWWPWSSPKGQKILFKVIKELKTLAQNNHIIKTYLNILARNAGGVDKGFYGVSDIFYIPRKFAHLFAFFSAFMVNHGLYHEITVPTIITGLTNISEIIRVPGTYLWYQERVLYPQFYNVSHLYLHTIKAGRCLKDNKCTTFLCAKYFPCLNMLGSSK